MSLPTNTLEFVIRLLGRASCAEDAHTAFASNVVGLMTEAEAFNAAHRCIGSKAPVLTASDPVLWAKHFGSSTTPREQSPLVSVISIPDLAVLNKVFADGGAAAITPDNATLVAKWYKVVDRMLAFKLLPVENVKKTGMLPVAAALLAVGAQDGAERDKGKTAEAGAVAVAVDDAERGTQPSPTAPATVKQQAEQAASRISAAALAGQVASAVVSQPVSSGPALARAGQPSTTATAGYPYAGTVRWPYYYPAAGGATPQGTPAAAVAAAVAAVAAAAAAAPVGTVQNVPAQSGSAQQVLAVPQRQALHAPLQRPGFKGNEFVGFEVSIDECLGVQLAQHCLPGCWPFHTRLTLCTMCNFFSSATFAQRSSTRAVTSTATRPSTLGCGHSSAVRVAR